MKIVFIILTYNNPSNLFQVLRALAMQCGEQHEIVIADDGSTETSVTEMKKKLPKFKCHVSHVWHPDTGFTISRARNLAVASSSADYLVFMDGDCIPNPTFVRAHELLAEKNFFVNGSRVLLSERLSQLVLNGTVDVSNASFLDWVKWRILGDSNKIFHLIELPDIKFRRNLKFRWKKIRGCNMAIWRSDYMRVNGFDESFQGWGHEDADLVLRLHNAGVHRKNGFCATEVYHLWHRENSRNQESVNKERVVQRLNSGLIRASQGVDEVLLRNDVVVTSLN